MNAMVAGIEAYTGIDESTAAYRCNDVSTSFKLVSLHGSDEKVITEFVHNASPVRKFPYDGRVSTTQ